MSQSHLVIDFPIEAPANAKALTEELPSLMPDFAKVQDDLGYPGLGVQDIRALLADVRESRSATTG